MSWFTHEAPSISRDTIRDLCQRLLDEAQTRLGCPLNRVLLLPPDLTRAHSGAGWITEIFYHLLPATAQVYVIPTLGQHVPHTAADNTWMFGSIPHDRILVHDWRNGVTPLGEIPADFVAHATGGKADWAMPICLNSTTVDQPWDLIINIGHVVPHEVLGFANHNKNYFIGLGGKDTICASHLASAVYGIENNLGNLLTPVRRCFNEAEDRFLAKLPDVYFQVVMDRDPSGALVHTGVYVGDQLDTYLTAARASREQNITVLDKPVKKIVAVMQADEFRATWVANKAVYRTRMAMADGGELLIIAPGVERFGEQPDVDALIRKYGYCGTDTALALYKQNADMQNLAHATAHLLHGSSEGRFTIRYATDKLTADELHSVHYQHTSVANALARYNPEKLTEGFNTLPDGEEIYFISTPSAGLWATRERLNQQTK